MPSERRSRALRLGALFAFAIGAWPRPAGLAPVAHADAAKVDRTFTAAAPTANIESPVDQVTSEGRAARGLYFNADVAAALGPRKIAQVVKGARMNAAVIDFKDERGRVAYPSAIPELQRSRSSVLGDPKAFVRKLKALGIYVIGRVVCFSDRRLPRRIPALAVLDARPYKRGQLWGTWARRNPWLDPYNRKNHDILVEVAREVEALGVDEIQLDYVRFPVDEGTRYADFPAKSETPRREIIGSFVERVDRALRVPLGVDVFGLTTMPWGDAEPLGQVPEALAPHVEVFTPMLYINGMSAWRHSDGGGRAERLIALGVSTLRKRIGDTHVIRPFLQGFPEGADSFDARFIAEQVRGAKRASADGFLFWHPACRYSVVREGMR